MMVAKCQYFYAVYCDVSRLFRGLGVLTLIQSFVPYPFYILTFTHGSGHYEYMDALLAFDACKPTTAQFSWPGGLQLSMP